MPKGENSFKKGRAKTGGRKKGVRNKSTIFLSLTDEERNEVFMQAMAMVRAKNVTILAKMIDKVQASKVPDEVVTNSFGLEAPEFENMPTDKLKEYIKKNG